MLITLGGLSVSVFQYFGVSDHQNTETPKY